MDRNEAAARAIAKAIYDKKGYAIQLLKVSHLTVLCDYMLIATARNANQNQALADAADDAAAQAGVELIRAEGKSEGRWIVLDYGFLMVHLFHQDARSYYNLERIWNDGTNRLDLDLQDEAD